MKPTYMRVAALVLFALLANATQAAIFTVGSGVTCTHGSIQGAINAAKNSGTDSIIRLTRSLTYEPEANTIDTTKEITVEGGYATCDQASPDTTNTIVSGVGANMSVFTIKAPTGIIVHLRRLTISGGNSGVGGGIYFSGDGILEIADSLITQNTAALWGGGIYARGTGLNAELVIGANVAISHNTAMSGGGVKAEDIEMSMLDPGSSLLLNHATNVGGGLWVMSSELPSYAYIGSGAALFGAAYGNDAKYGGGVYISSSAQVAQLQLFATDPARPAYVGYNSASVQGGGIFASGSNASARLWNATLDNNDAPNGAAAYLELGAGFYANFAALPVAAAGCAVGVECGRIANNTTGTNPGSIIYGESGTTVQFGYLPTATPADARGGVLILRNTAGSIFGGAATTQIHRSVIGSNTTSKAVIQQSGNSLDIDDSTIAGNTIGGGSAIIQASSSAVTIQRAILWQPGVTSLSRSGGSLSVQRSDASENTSLGGYSAADTYNPRFVDPAHDDYGLRAGSVLIDYAYGPGTNDRDALGRPRNIDLDNRDNPGTRDIGALERQSVQPLVLNPDIDTDLRLWDVVISGAATRDNTQNVSGPSSSGSAHIHVNNPYSTQQTRGLSQCIHLPANGTYALNGWGRGTSTGPVFQPIAGDRAELYWEYRTNGGENCDLGPIQASGTLMLSNTSSWSRPAQPVLIPVNQLFSGYSPSIRIYLVATEAGTNLAATDAWFDGITLDYTGDRIFANGFE